MPKYSICITHYNNRSTVEESLQSILGQISRDFEIVLVDSRSNDGSTEILRKYATDGKIKLIETKCSRGLGRQIALENSTGDYVISGLDMDDIFKPTLFSILDFYHSMTEGKLLTVVNGETTMVCTRALLNSLGGWRDLQFRENWELARRAAKEDNHRWTIFPIVVTITSKERRKSVRSSLGYRYMRYRDNLRVGHKQFDQGEKKGISQEIFWLLARLAVLFLPKYKADYAFTSIDPKDFVDSQGNWPKGDNIDRERQLYRALLKREI
ncbi:MAG TPA: glycosyltransferase family 2 protein [Nitrososphaerales archaeon]|nr:glycosyltransferase family 2 protein [Nitrososphaerales archaeon]